MKFGMFMYFFLLASFLALFFSLLSMGNKLSKESCCKNLIFLFLKFVNLNHVEKSIYA